MIRDGRIRRGLETVRVLAFVLGCGLLFWQDDAAPVDWLFALGIIASAALWEGGLPAFDFAWPQPLLVLFVAVTAAATTLAGGSPRFFAITAYLILLALALSSVLRQDPRRVRAIETAIVVAACVTAITITAGPAATWLNLPSLDGLSSGTLLGHGLFKDPNDAEVFVACSYPLVAAYCIRQHRGRLVLLLIATALFGGGVLFSYSPLALGLWAIAVAAVILVLAIRHERRMCFVFGACVLVAAGGVASVGKFPLWRYQLAQQYDANLRFVAWRFGLDMVLESPLGTGSGSYERRTEAYFDAERLRAIAEHGADEGENLLRNGAPDGTVGWSSYPATAPVTVVDDATSVTGHAFRKTAATILAFQEIPVVAGRTYSFAAQIRTDGAPASLGLLWLGDNHFIISQERGDLVTSTRWTEIQLAPRIAPAGAKAAELHLVNTEPGEQYFAAIRMVEGARVPPWSVSMQWRISTERPAVMPVSADNTYLRIATESGLPGLLALCAYWALLAWSAWTRGRTSWQWPLAFSLVLLAGVVIDTLHWRQLWVYTAVVPVLISGARPSERKTLSDEHADRATRSPSIS